LIQPFKDQRILTKDRLSPTTILWNSSMRHNSGAAWMETITKPSRKTANQRDAWRDSLPQVQKPAVSTAPPSGLEVWHLPQLTSFSKG
jgi:hypothetical protein